MSLSSGRSPDSGDIFRTIVEAIEEIPADASPDSPLEEVGVDSLTVIEVAALARSRFGIQVQHWELLEAETLGGIARVIQAKVARRA